MSVSSKSNTLAGVAIGLGLIAAGLFINKAINSYPNNNFITVKGLIEEERKADYVLWGIGYNAANKDFALAKKSIDEQSCIIKNFLKDNGFDSSEYELANIRIFRNHLQDSNNDYQEYNIDAVILLSTSKVDAVEKASANMFQLVNQGVMITEAQPKFLLQSFAEIRPALGAKAISNAKSMATSLAHNVGAKVGRIKSANQGNFEILPKTAANEYSSHNLYKNKIIRLVNSVTFELEY